MAAKLESSQTYFELTEHNAAQIIIFLFIIIGTVVALFSIVLPILKDFFEVYLQGYVHYKNGEFVSYSIDKQLPTKETSYLFSWAIDFYKGSLEELRYWFNPVVSLLLPLTIVSIGIASFFSTMLPRKIGFLRQKIDREIANYISKIAYNKYGMHSESEHKEIINELLNASIEDLHSLAEDFKVPYSDLLVLQKAIKIQQYSLLKRLLHVNDSLLLYMRFYFTIKYSNIVLGFVYMGAAILIIIIGLRGLKFIPSTQPSLVLFALGLEFTLLITYALTLMYSKLDEESDMEHYGSVNDTDRLLLSNDFGSSKDIEKLLRVFIKSRK